MHRQKRILVCWHAYPGYIPPFVLSDRQIVVGPKLFADQPQMMFACWTPAGAYDLKFVLKSNGVTPPFDAIVVWADAGGTNLPFNLEAFDCPKVLCVGDTHHLRNPLTVMLSYAVRARYDFIVSSHNRQHLHWFSEAGFSSVAWLPGLKVRYLPRPFSTARRTEIAFVGNVKADYHLRRLRLLDRLRHEGLPLKAAMASYEESLDAYASSAVSFNISLNGDLNLRVFEILAAGGCLLTDRLSPQSGIDLILEEGRHYLGYDTAEECVAQARALLTDPARALDLASSGHRAFLETMRPERRAEELLDWVFQGRLDSLFQAPAPSQHADKTISLNDRLRVYEHLQELHRVEEAPRVLFHGEVPEIYRSDAADLRRLRIFSANAAAPVTNEKWDCVVAKAGADPPSSIAKTKTVLPVP